VATGSPGSEINPQSTELSAGNRDVGDGGGGEGGGTFTGSGGRDAVGGRGTPRDEVRETHPQTAARQKINASLTQFRFLTFTVLPYS